MKRTELDNVIDATGASGEHEPIPQEESSTVTENTCRKGDCLGKRGFRPFQRTWTKSSHTQRL